MKYKFLTHSIVLVCLLTGFALMAYVNVERQKLDKIEHAETSAKTDKYKTCKKA